MIKQKGFSLIELLVVVAIIGILAAVGVVAYNGYTAAAKVNATKSIHANALKLISAEASKCSLEPSGKYMGDNNCSGINAHNMVNAAIAYMSDKNPHDVSKKAITDSQTYVKGQVSIHDDGEKIELKTCVKDDCSAAENQLTGEVEVN